MDAEAQFNLGCHYRDGEDYTEAAKWFRMAAEQGHSDAQYWLGWCYGHGLGVEYDSAEAEKWVRMSAFSNMRDTLVKMKVDGTPDLLRDLHKTLFP